MIEKIVLDFLNNNLTAPAYMEEQREEKERFVLVEKVGSSDEDFIKSATITIQSFAPTMFDAASLNEEVKATIREIVSLPQIVDISLNSDYNYTDTNQKRYRYQAVFDVIYY